MIKEKGICETAMVLAAGLGTRMRPLTEATPKPLLHINGRAMLDLAIDHLIKVGVTRVVVNAHHLADQIKAHLEARKDIETVLSFEERVLDTGGGVKKARHYFGEKPFILLGGDMPCFDEKEPTLKTLIDAWDPEIMDELMLLYPTKRAKGFDTTKGDFMRSPDSRLWRQGAPYPRTHVWLSAQIVKPFLYDEVDREIFSNNILFDRCEATGRLYGVEHKGTCYHVGTPDDLAQANCLLDDGVGWG